MLFFSVPLSIVQRNFKTTLSLNLPNDSENHSVCPTVCDPMQSMEFSRPEYWSGLPFPSPGDLPNPGIKPRSPALQAHSLLFELLGKPVCIRYSELIRLIAESLYPLTYLSLFSPLLTPGYFCFFGFAFFRFHM